jgi:biopolymer transport protein ExbD
MAFSMAGGGPSDPQINVTPLIDVLLVLIIVFMVVQSMSTTKVWKHRFHSPRRMTRVNLSASTGQL